MQDRFKYRCWHEPTKTMYEVFDFNENFIRATPDFVVPSIRTLKTRDCVLLQCTGLKDKNGKLIYEGDIIKIPNDYDTYGMFAGEKREVYFYEGGFRLKPKWDKNSRGNWLEDTNDFEVIGNIYDNSRL